MFEKPFAYLGIDVIIRAGDVVNKRIISAQDVEAETRGRRVMVEGDARE